MVKVIRIRGLRAVVLVAGMVICCSCADRESTTLIHIAPTDRWADEVKASRARKDALFRTDPDTPLLAESLTDFKGLDYWEPDPSYYLCGTLIPYDDPEKFTIISTTGEQRPCEKLGYITFELHGVINTLQVYRMLDSETVPGRPSFFLPFNDSTTGDETYPAGRYVDLSGPERGPYVLDFNTAYNPYCAYGGAYSCPVTPPDNRLAIPIHAGERGYHRAGEDG